MTEEKIVELWKEVGVSEVRFIFDCGGDNMGNTDIEIVDENGEPIESEIIKDFIDNEVYKKVEFYVNSDGHYMGENGTVTVTLDDDDTLLYSKDAQSEFSESISSEETITLTDEEAKFVADYVLNINGGDGGNTVNYKTDFILTDKEEKIETKLTEKIESFVSEFVPEHEGELSDWFTYTTNEDGELKLVGNELTLLITNSASIFRDSND